MNELEALKKLVQVLTNQRNFALDSLAKMEATMLMERDAAAAKQAEQREREAAAAAAAAKEASSKDKKPDGPALVASINAAVRNGSRLRTS